MSMNLCKIKRNFCVNDKKLSQELITALRSPRESSLCSENFKTMDTLSSTYIIIFTVFEIISILLNVFGNSIVCYVMIFKNKLAKSSNYFMLSVAVSDLLVALVSSR
jgi:hypothetical protein